jgi:hypothetical protein
MNSENEINKLKEKTKVFFENKVFIFIKLINERGYKLYNGYITKLDNDYFLIEDYKTKNKIPIFFYDLLKQGSIIDASRRESNG